MNKKLTTPKGSLIKTKRLNNNSSNAQRNRIIERLRQVKGIGLTTIEIRDELNCLHPSGRIMELRKHGYDIRSIWTNGSDHYGRPHRVARYVLFSEQEAIA
jgi:hypothetical protein